VVGGQIVFTWTTPNAATGTLVAVYRDTAGNETTRNISVPLTLNSAPTRFTLVNDTGISNSDGITSNATLSWNAVVGASSYEVSANGTTWTDIGNVLTIDAKVTLGLGDGTYTLQIRAKNAAGAGPIATKTLTLDTV
jgi:hypothetical protein